MAQATGADETYNIRDGNGRPHFGDKLLKDPIGFDGTEALDIVAKPYNSHGFKFTV